MTALPEKMKVIIANAVDAASADMCCGACSQAASLSPPVAMSAFYLVLSEGRVTAPCNQIFSGMMPHMLIVILCMVLTRWLQTYLYGN
jgi:TRAP-type mannitol/chloroaromatic compound transport system permease large subunit